MINKKNKIFVSFILLCLTIWNGNILAAGNPAVFPIPSYTIKLNGKFIIEDSTVIINPVIRDNETKLISNLLQSEFTDKYAYPLNIIKTNSIPLSRKFILIGSLNNSLVKKYCVENSLTDKINELGNEGYILTVNTNNVIVAAKTNQGALYGFQTLRQLLKKENNRITLPKIKIEDKPQLPFRGIKMFLPGRDNITFFKRFIRDFMAKYKFNKLILELNANMRLESHPELNVGTIEFGYELNASRRGRPSGPHNEYQNSSHQDNADGKILEKWEVADLINYVRKFNIEVIPEIPSLTHSYYLLFGHKDLAELPDREYPDTYCPLKPEIYNIYFDVLTEYIDVIHPKIIHVGHDEWRMEKDVCQLCKGKDYGKLYADDINRIHDFLKANGIRTAIWGDHLLESVRKKEYRVWKTSSGYEYKIPGALKPEQVRSLIPKDILIFNWFWSKTKDGGYGNDLQVSDFGFEQVYGNLRPDIKKWNERVKIKGVIGGAPSSWAATTEFNIGKDQIYDFLGCANLLWSKHYKTPEDIAFITQELIPEIKEEISGVIPPSKKGFVKPIDISSNYNSTLQEGIDSLNGKELKIGKVNKGNLIFEIPCSEKHASVVYSTKNSVLPKKVSHIKINQDVNSIIFLHASAKEAANKKAYKMIYNFDDTAELLGWYEIVYNDGFIITIPIRYGVNILDWNVYSRIINKKKGKTKYGQNKYAYEATDISVSKSKKPITFFVYEWENKRPGKIIKEINLKAVNHKSKSDNAVILLAVSVVESKKAKEAIGEETE